MTEFTVAILAGGKSSRMGTNKAFVDLNGRTLIAHMLDRIGQVRGVAEVLLIANQPDDYAHLELPTFPDLVPGKGALGGIYTAICHSQHAATLVLACDMPLISPALLAYMAALNADEENTYDVIVPRVEGYPQGLHALYNQSCRETIKNDLEADRLKVIGFYNKVRTRYLDEPDCAPYVPHEHTFININTPDDLATVRALLADS